MRTFSVFFMAALAVGAIASQGCSADATDSSTDDLKKACKGPLPDLCELCDDGTTQCAHWVKENGKCEVQICPPAKPECKKASDCTGPLPMLCEVCSDGGEACAHHACVDGQCTTAICN